MLALIPGLGCDHRVFAQLQLRAPQQQILRYIPPASPAESLSDYARRLAEQITAPERTVLVGMSLGGILALEIARQLPIRRVALISSIKGHAERPPQLSALAFLPLHRWLSPEALKWLNAATADTFIGVQTTAEAQLLQAIIADTDARFIQWAVHRVITWHSTWQPPRLLHLHGTDDRIFSPDYITQARWITRGTHWMVLQRATEISHILNTELAADWA